MDNKSRKQEERKKGQWEMMAFIIALVIGFVLLVFLDKKFAKKIEYRPFEGEVKTYDGSLNRNLSNPLGLE
ncbi:MAG: hypothetical protein HY810_04965 [Candidatus Omnitrophica bacterium]|nr:hypothetical protein [Candidatus Omnitrophota bacterium]